MNGYPNCVVSPFGSTVNGLGFRGCDVDIYLDLGQYAFNDRDVRVKTMAVKLMYFPNDDTQNNPFSRLQLVVETFEHSI